ncbi:MAG: LytTR family DNA-binding domain-containing protein [Coriobacteriia bacterium]|jgi:two-component system response regulator LytT|nr:LytTR family DNA-binding domain-containing protein [Coriobacteriia bacterium]MDR2714699.1 LytTR family DNA-binding domain-containing protein [Coriobacteriales bacterium]
MIKAIIVDDEAPARSELRFLLDEAGGVEVVAEAANVREAIECLKDKGADVMFMDIQMPGANGLQLAEALERLKYPPAVVFVTAYSEYATEAFDVSAVDYLLKPVETERLVKALARVKHFVSVYATSGINERIPVEKNGKRRLIAVGTICYIMARDDYSYLYTEQDRYLSTVSLAQLETKLESFGFFRVHRRYLVNLACVEEITPVSGGTLLLSLKGESEEIPVSRRRVTALKKALGL